MLVYHILDENKARLKFLGKSMGNVDLISTAITEFKKHNILTSDLDKNISETEDKYLKTKLEDLNIIYKSLEETVKSNYIDEDDLLNILYEKIDKSEMFKNAEIYIDQFAGFTEQEYSIISKLLEAAKKVNITICSDSLEISNDPDIDIFYTNKQTVKKLKDVASKGKISIDEPVELKETYRFKEEGLKHLEQNMYKYPYKTYKKDAGIYIYAAQNPYLEVENIAKQISLDIRNNEKRYRQIAVITKDLNTYASIIFAVFTKYKIPFFIDEKKQLSSNILIRLILGIIDIFAKNWSYEVVFGYLKTNLLKIESSDINKLEAYCLKWGIRGSTWYKEDWKFPCEQGREELDHINALRKEIVEPLLSFKEKLKGTKTVKEITESLYSLLIELDIGKSIEEKREKLDAIKEIEVYNEYATVWNIVIEVFDEIVQVLGSTKITFDKYKEILKIGISSRDLGKIPASLDQVIIGDMERTSLDKIDDLYIMGLNDGVIPDIYKDEGFLNDKDREKLKQGGINLAKSTKERLYEEQFNIYRAFTIPEKNLYLSYHMADFESKAVRPSILIYKIKNIFPVVGAYGVRPDVCHMPIYNADVTFEELLQNLQRFQNTIGNDALGDQRNVGNDAPVVSQLEIFEFYYNSKKYKQKLLNVLKGLKYTNATEKINKQNIKKLYDSKLKTSISRLETYRACPFSFYLKYGLKLKEKSTFKIEAVDTGSFIHDVIDEFFTFISRENLNIKKLTEDETQDIINQIIEEKLKLNKNYIFTSSAKFIVLTNRLKRVIAKAMKYIIYGLKNSSFEVLANEAEFGDESRYPSIKAENEDATYEIEITGRIDRIDIGLLGDKKYIRVIDYKSGIKNLDLSDVYNGLQLQLLTYLDAVSAKEEAEPAGVLYFNLIDPIIKNAKNLTDEEIEEEIKRQFKMKGLVLADVDVVRLMDNKLDKKGSDTIPVYIKTDETFSERDSSVATKEEFKNLQKYIRKLLKDISNEMLSGDISVKPYYKSKKTPCEYCNFKSICQFDANLCGNEYNYIEKYAKNVVLDKIGKEV